MNLGYTQARSQDFAMGAGSGGGAPAAENFCIFYLKIVNFTASNCKICCNNVLCFTYYTNYKHKIL